MSWREHRNERRWYNNGRLSRSCRPLSELPRFVPDVCILHILFSLTLPTADAIGQTKNGLAGRPTHFLRNIFTLKHYFNSFFYRNHTIEVFLYYPVVSRPPSASLVAILAFLNLLLTWFYIRVRNEDPQRVTLIAEITLSLALPLYLYLVY